MIRKLALGLFLLITAAVITLLAIAGLRPATFHVERSTSTIASAATVFAIVGDLARFHEWSPWRQLDPAMRSTVQGSGVGVGSSYSWSGSDEVGEGRMTITESVAPSLVALKLEFLRPFRSTNDVYFRIVPEGEGSRVTWAVDGSNNFAAKVMSLFMSMDSVLGRDLSSGLANLKQLSERP